MNFVLQIRALLDHIHTYWIQQVGLQSFCLHWRSFEVDNNAVTFHTQFSKQVGNSFTNIWHLLGKKRFLVFS